MGTTETDGPDLCTIAEDTECAPVFLEAAARKALDCPCCTDILGRIAIKLPMAHQEHSALICRLSGVKMDENNPPVMLPNGQVYSLEALQGIAQNGRVACPI